jgi:hypothetical protein
MVNLQNWYMLLGVLLIAMCCLYALLGLIGNSNPNLRDTVLAIGGAIFGGIGVYYYQKAFE